MGRFDHSAKTQFNAGELAYDLRRAIAGTRTIPDSEAFLTQLRQALEGSAPRSNWRTRPRPASSISCEQPHPRSPPRRPRIVNGLDTDEFDGHD